MDERERQACLRLVRLAARREALGRDWWPGCVNVPTELGMTPEVIRLTWAAAATRAKHLLALVGRA